MRWLILLLLVSVLVEARPVREMGKEGWFRVCNPDDRSYWIWVVVDGYTEFDGMVYPGHCTTWMKMGTITDIDWEG